MSLQRLLLVIATLALFNSVQGQTLPNCTTNPCILQNFPTVDRPLITQMPVTVQLLYLKWADQCHYEIVVCYEEKAIGPITKGKYRRPRSEWTKLNKETAIAQAQYRWQTTFFPQHFATFQAIMRNWGLDPNVTTEDPANPQGLGNLIFRLVREATFYEKVNVLGDQDIPQINWNARQNFSDTTKFNEPLPVVNPPYLVLLPDTWQPLRVQETSEIPSRFYIRTQNFITPQFRNANVTLITNAQRDAIQFPPQNDTYFGNPPIGFPPSPGYKSKVEYLIAVSAGLTDYQKMAAEFFDNKVLSLGAIGGFAVNKYFPNDTDQYLKFEMLSNSALIDILPSTWRDKPKYNGIRPVSAIHFLKNDTTIKSWGGPGKGTVTMKGRDWTSYLKTDAHPEYPSGTSCVCAIFASISKLFFGTDNLGFSFTFQPGSSVFEPGVTPKQAVTLTYATFTDMYKECGQSRIWGGVHFPQSVSESQKHCYPPGQQAYDAFQKLLNGQLP